MFIPKAFIDELLERVDMPELIQSFIPVKKMGNHYKACCPFHQEKNPSFSIDPKRPLYHCFGCGASGNALNFLREYLNLSFVDAVEYLANYLHIELPKGEDSQHDARRQQEQLYYQLLSRVSQYYQQQLRDSSEAIDYLKHRGLTGQICKTYQIGFAPPGWDNVLKSFEGQSELLLETGMLTRNEQGRVYDRFRHRIMFPIINRRGQVIAFGGRVLQAEEPKYLNSPETPIFHKGREWYGLYQALKAEHTLSRVLIVEGYMDVVSLAQFGITYALATLGTAVSSEQLQWILKKCPHLIFCFDGDAAGLKAAWRAAEICLPLLQDNIQVQFLFLPKQDDPDSYVRRHGKNAFEAKMNEALNIADYLFQRLSHEMESGKIEGKAGLIHAATPYLQKIPGRATQVLLCEKLSTFVHIEPSRLMSMMQLEPVAKPVARAASRPQKKIPSTLRTMCALLLQHPILRLEIPENYPLEELSLPGTSFLREIIQHIDNGLCQDPDMLISTWPNSATREEVQTLLNFQHSLPSEKFSAEFVGSLTSLLQQQRQQTITQLLLKANQSGLSADEKAELDRLIRSR